MADIRIPVSPVHGMVNTLGDATHRPLIQLLNPAGSLKDLYVFELRLGNTGTVNRVRIRRTNAPLTLAGTVTTATLFRRNELDATAIVATLKGCTAVATQPPFNEVDSFWFEKISSDASPPYTALPLMQPLTFPLIIKQGSALEFAGDDANSAAIAIRLYAVWDEITH